MSRLIVGCESSGVVREAFRAKGVDAWSCDLQPADDGSEFHIQGDVFDALANHHWDAGIFHPECTYLCSSGLHWNRRGRMVDGRPRAELTEEALEFVQRLMDCGLERWAIENPKGCISTRIRKPDQYVQPWMFGDDASKETGLWLHNLPCLVETDMVPGRIVGKDARGRTVARWSNQTDSGQNRLPPSEDRWKLRSRTYDGIANAMASQWAHLL